MFTYNYHVIDHIIFFVYFFGGPSDGPNAWNFRGEAINFRGEASGDRGEATGFRQWPLHKWIHCFQTPSALGSSFDKQNALQQTRKCLEIRALGTSET